MTWDDAKRAAMQNGRLIKRANWQYSVVGYDRVRETFFIRLKEGADRSLFVPKPDEKNADNWIFA